MLVLGLETSCDDTAAAVLRDGKNLLSNIINDQTRVHSRYGGIVPELAGRSHVDQVQKVIRQSLESAQVELSEIDVDPQLLQTLGDLDPNTFRALNNLDPQVVQSLSDLDASEIDRLQTLSDVDPKIVENLGDLDPQVFQGMIY